MGHPPYAERKPYRRFEQPHVVVAELPIFVPPPPPPRGLPVLKLCRFRPVCADTAVYIYGENHGTPRDRMRRNALLDGERCRAAPFERIGV